MLNQVFRGLFDSDSVSSISIQDFMLCIGVSLLLGLILAGFYMYHSIYSKGFVATLAVLPAAVCVVILMVNGSIGTGIAVAGAFSLVRFRSAAGSAKEINALFIAMTTGLLTGMGYLGFACLAVLLLGGVSALYSRIDFGAQRSARYKTLHITIPEDLDYTDVFDPILHEYTDRYEVMQVKTTNMGSLFKLTYNLTLKDVKQEKALIDQLRVRNGNLEISISRQEVVTGEL